MGLLAPALLLVASSAPADDHRPPRLNDRSALLVTFEHMFGAVYGGYERRQSLSHVGVGSTFGPRIGVHGMLRGGFTAGGLVSALSVYDRGRSRAAVFFTGPRFGWLFTGDVVGVWPRLGLNVLVAGNDGLILYSFDLPLTIHVTEHAAFVAGPSIEASAINEGYRDSYFTFHLNAGLLGAF